MTCSKIFSGDLPEITNKIIQYFQNDYETLFSCILINRFWCRLTIPLLWEDPFSKNHPKNYHFIEIYLYKSDKTKLNEYGINNIVFPSNTLYNYPYFIKHLRLCNILRSIEYWTEFVTVHRRHDIPYRNEISKLIYISLLKVFIENEVSLHTCEFDDYYGYVGNIILSSLKNSNFSNIIKIII